MTLKDCFAGESSFLSLDTGDPGSPEQRLVPEQYPVTVPSDDTVWVEKDSPFGSQMSSLWFLQASVPSEIVGALN
jgi:hypothetical protein